MRDYEFFCVLSQDFTEEESQQLLGTVKEALVSVGADGVEDQSLGKQRLAYQFPGRQAYGTFGLINFVAEPDSINAFKEKIRFEEGISRYVVRLRTVQTEKSAQKEEVAVKFSTKVEKEEKKKAEVSDDVVSPEVEIRTGGTESEVPVAETKKEAPTLSQEELDKRIDALLSDDDIKPESL